jgi:hypothetical protein
VQCRIGQVIDQECSGMADRTYEPWGLKCTGSGSSQIEIRATDECGLDNYDDGKGRYQRFNVTLS